MCRNIKLLFNFEPPVTDAEIGAAVLQFVRKISGFNAPSKVNDVAFQRAITEISESCKALLASLETTAPPRDRATEAAKARARSASRFQSFEPREFAGNSRPK